MGQKQGLDQFVV